MSGESLETYGRLSKALKEPYSIAPILMTGGLIASIALTLSPRNIVADLGLVTAILIAVLGGLMELYYMVLVSWASNAILSSWALNTPRGGSPSFKDILYTLLSIGLYYTLIGVAMLSLKVNSYSKELACNCSSSTLYSILTLGVHLARSQACLSACASIKIEELYRQFTTESLTPSKAEIGEELVKPSQAEDCRRQKAPTPNHPK